MSDEDVIDKILHRDKRALFMFYRRYAPKLARFIKLRVENDHDAEELLQDTLFAFLEAIRDFHGSSRLETFLFSICKHKIVDFYRKKKIKHFVFSQLPRLESLVSPLITPEAAFDEGALRDKIHAVFSSLTPVYRRILTLRYLENFSVAEIARMRLRSCKSAESQLFRARKAFIQAFRGD